MLEKTSTWMKDPKYYIMLKEKPDGIKLGALSFPILFKDTMYLLPSDAGDKLVSDGYAKEAISGSLNDHLKDLSNDN